MSISEQSSNTIGMRLMTLLFGGRLPKPRAYDLLTDDHPYRLYWGNEPARCKAILRGVVFVAVCFGIMIVGSAIVMVPMMMSALTLSADSAAATATDTDALIDDMTMDMRSPAMIATSAMQLAGAIIAYIITVRVMEQRKSPVELQWRRLVPDLLCGMAFGFVAISASVLVIAMFGGYRIVGVNGGYDPWADLFLMGVVAGVSEEIMMRGVLFRLVEEWVGTWGALGISAFVFGIMHWGNADGTLWGSIAIAIEAGVLLAAVYVVTRSLWWCMGLHFMWNVTEGPIFGSIVSGNGNQQSWLIAQWGGPDWLTGGRFGLEASVIPVILLGAVSVLLMHYARRCGMIVAPLRARKRMLIAQAEEIRRRQMTD
ncbi:abortive infection protein [Bifidobacterium sp. DSM 109957]|uniref:Abortive infection protein n=2 Tax=Bifidobacterium oedipodis TaxID=2675322 RepID=A0A7Y0EQ45_9BIFI|nr:abortive infection protein [Bifidobacterium sp. DSM 109957]